MDHSQYWHRIENSQLIARLINYLSGLRNDSALFRVVLSSVLTRGIRQRKAGPGDRKTGFEWKLFHRRPVVVVVVGREGIVYQKSGSNCGQSYKIGHWMLSWGVFLKWGNSSLFVLTLVFSTKLTEYVNKKANGWELNRVLGCWKRPLCKLCHLGQTKAQLKMRYSTTESFSHLTKS